MQQCKSFQHEPDILMCCTLTHAARHSSQDTVLGYTAAKSENPTTISVWTESIQHFIVACHAQKNTNHTKYEAPQISSTHVVPLREVENNKTKISIIIPNQLQYLSTMIKAVITGINIWLEKL